MSKSSIFEILSKDIRCVYGACFCISEKMKVVKYSGFIPNGELCEGYCCSGDNYKKGITKWGFGGKTFDSIRGDIHDCFSKGNPKICIDTIYEHSPLLKITTATIGHYCK